MSNLFNIQEKYLMLMSQIEELEGELTPEVEEQLNINREELEEKLKAYYYIIKTKEGEIQLAKDEIDRLRQVMESKSNLIQKLKSKVNDALKLFGEQGKSGNFKLKLENLSIYNVYNKPVIVEDSFSDSRYYNYSIDHKLNKDQVNKLKDAFLEATGLDIVAASSVTVDKKKLKSDLEVTEDEIKGARIDYSASYVVFR